jgi:hypothetical protein
MNMNSVDHFVQLKSLYEINRKSKKWWHRIFFFFLDAVVVNAFFLHKQFADTPMKLKNFRHEVIAGFVAVTTWAGRQTGDNPCGIPLALPPTDRSRPGCLFWRLVACLTGWQPER